MPFRAQYKTVGLTYSRCPITKEELRDFIANLPFRVADYYIVQETHKEEKGCKYHLHAWFEYDQKPNIRSEAFYDIVHEGKTYHPNIGKKKRNWIWNYLKKQDNNPVTNISDGYVELAKAGKLTQALEQFSNMHPKEYVIHYDRVKRNMQLMGKKARPENVYPFTGDVVEWDMDQKSLLVIGPSRTGKTEWAKSFVTHHLKKTYFRVTHIDRLKKFDGQDCIIYDDISFHHLPRETQIHIAEVRNQRDIHCRNTTADIPPGIIQIFCNNEHPFSHDPHGAIENRLHLAPQIRFY